MVRETKEEYFLQQFWRAVSPEFEHLNAGEQAKPAGTDVVPVKIISDFLKLIFDPYIAQKNEEIFR